MDGTFLWNAQKHITNPLCWKLSRNTGRITHLVSMFVLAKYPFAIFIVGCTCTLNVCCPQVLSKLDILVEMLICWRTTAKVEQAVSRIARCTAADAQLTVTLSDSTKLEHRANLWPTEITRISFLDWRERSLGHPLDILFSYFTTILGLAAYSKVEQFWNTLSPIIVPLFMWWLMPEKNKKGTLIFQSRPHHKSQHSRPALSKRNKESLVSSHFNPIHSTPFPHFSGG